MLADPKDGTRVMFYEVYADDKAFDAHQQTAHFKKYVAEAVPFSPRASGHFWKRVAP